MKWLYSLDSTVTHNYVIICYKNVPRTAAHAMIAGTAEGEGLVGPRPHHFLAPPPLLFALKRKIIQIKKRLETSIFPSLFCYILCIFFNFKRQAFVGLLCFSW